MMKVNYYLLNVKVINIFYIRKLLNFGKYECSIIFFYNMLIRWKFGIFLFDIGWEWFEVKVNWKK